MKQLWESPDFSGFHSVPIFTRYIPSFPPNMPTVSTATTSVACNNIPDNETELLKWMCVLVLARSNDTPYNTASIQEEDIVELCVEVGQMHPKGVLQFSVTELVILFHCSNKCSLWHVEPKPWLCMKNQLRLHTSPPSTAHLRAFIAVRDGWPSGAQSLTPR